MKKYGKEKPRVLVLTDISSMESGVREPDDAQSMIRFLLYANEFDIEGLIACAYGDSGIHPEYIRRIVDAYGEVCANLQKHDSSYPSADRLYPLIKSGNPGIGMERLGEGQDTEASEWILSAVDKEDDRPLWILLWGGALDLAQAVWKARKTRSREAFEAFQAKLRVYAIGDQYDGAGPWIRENFPGIFYITNYASFRGMYRFGEQNLADDAWVKKNICENHGALGALYPVYNGGDPWGEVHGIKEGDTPSFLYLVPDGLNDPEQPEQESWGGRFVRIGPRRYRDMDPEEAKDLKKVEACAAEVAKWRSDYQKDFRKRMEWCI